jgi:hypothetical protein
MFLKGSQMQNTIFASNDQLIGNVVGVERSVIGHVLNFVRIFGSGIALIAITVMAIQYFTADGRGAPMIAEKKAMAKGIQMKNFIIGAIIFIGASNIIYFIEQFIEQILKDI